MGTCPVVTVYKNGEPSVINESDKDAYLARGYSEKSGDAPAADAPRKPGRPRKEDIKPDAPAAE